MVSGETPLGIGQQTSKGKKDMETLYQNGLLITRAKNLKDSLDEILRSAMELTETPAGSIALIEGEEMVMATQKGFSQGFFGKTTMETTRRRPYLPYIETNGSR